MSHMQPEVYHGDYYEVETTEGTIFIPADVCGYALSLSDFEEYVGGNILEDPAQFDFKPKNGWLYRLQAPGYMDATDWSVAKTEAEAYAELLSAYGSDEREYEEDWEAEARVLADESKYCEGCGSDFPPEELDGNGLCSRCWGAEDCDD
jgi:hypothetical protein